MLAPYLVNSASRLAHGSPASLFTAGWATAGFAPVAASRGRRVRAVARGDSQVAWHETPGGDSFRHGWRLSFLISLPALIALRVFRLPTMLPGRSDRLLRAAGSLVAATSALALLSLYTSTH